MRSFARGIISGGITWFISDHAKAAYFSYASVSYSWTASDSIWLKNLKLLIHTTLEDLIPLLLVLAISMISLKHLRIFRYLHLCAGFSVILLGSYLSVYLTHQPHSEPTFALLQLGLKCVCAIALIFAFHYVAMKPAQHRQS